MKLRSALLAAGASALAFGALGAVEDGGWFAFEPAHDDFQPNVLDCSRWIETPAWKHGFRTAKGEQFVFQDGAPGPVVLALERAAVALAMKPEHKTVYYELAVQWGSSDWKEPYER